MGDRYKGNTHTPMSWQSVLHEDDVPILYTEWAKLIELKQSVSFGIRLKKNRTSLDPLTGDIIQDTAWILATGTPCPAEDDSGTIIIGCVTDISRQKYNEDMQKRRTEEAMETKRQQEKFIDMTSHEIRNPLSAILQCADAIVSALSALLNEQKTSIRSRSLNGALSGPQVATDWLAEI